MKFFSGSAVRRRAAAFLTVAALGTAALGSASAGAVATTTVAHWKMNESYGATTLVDSSGKGRHGKIGSGVRLGSGYYHRFVTRTASDGYVDGQIDTVPHHVSLNPDSGDFTFTVRYRTTRSFGNILQKGQGSSTGGYWKLDAPNGKPRCLFRGGNGSSRSGYTSRDLSDGAWHTVRCVRTSGYVEMFVDGVRTSRAEGKSGWIANSAVLSIGGKARCGGKVSCDYFAGDIDYVEIKKG